ncbi:MAG TPA: hypothetical protein VF916_03520 [Ktedonobacterales bacterium]
MDLLYLRAIGLPFLLLCGIIGLNILRGIIVPATRGFLLALWGSTLLLFAGATATAALLWADETPTQMANNVRSDLVVGACAIACFALGLALGCRARIEGEHFFIAFVRPPASVHSTSLRGWAILPLLFLWLALVLVLGAFAATYGVLSHFTLAG